jgi:amino acid adenylation domain-containing protein
MQAESSIIELKFSHHNLILRDHKVYDVSIVPGVTFLDVLSRCLQQEGWELNTTLISDVLFSSPLATAAGLERLAQVELNFIKQTFSIKSRCLTKDIASNDWTMHAEGRFQQAQALTKKQLDIALLKQQAVKQFPIEDIYAYIRQKAIAHGPFMQAGGQVYVGKHDVLAELWLSEEAEAYLAKFYLHPALLDGSTLLGFAPFLNEHEVNKLPIPFYIRSLQSLRSLPSPCYVHVTLKPEQNIAGDTVETNLEYYDSLGQRVAIMQGLIGKQIRNPQHITQLIQQSATTASAIPASAAKPTQAVIDEIIEESAALSHIIAKDIMQIIQQQFGKTIDASHRQQDFYSLGFDSMQLVQLVRELENRLGESLYPTLLFEYRTIEQLAHYFAERFAENYPLTHNGVNEIIQPMSHATDTLCYYQSGWDTAELKLNDSIEPAKIGWGLFLVPDGNFSAKLAQGLTRQGATNTIIVIAGSHYQWLSAKQIEINIAEPNDYQRLFIELQQRQQLPDYVVHAFSAEPTAAFTQALDHYLSQGVFSLWMLLQAYLQQIGNKPLKLLYAYQAAQANQPYFASMAGWLRCLKVELGQWSSRVVGWFPFNIASDQWLSQVYAELADLSTTEVLEINYQDERRYRKTLKSALNLARQDFTLHAQGVYLLTGGLGGIGRLLAKDLAAKPGIKLALTGRSQPTASQLALIQALGAQVVYLSADLAKRDDVARLLTKVEAQLGPLKGIIHAAGVVKDSLITNQSRAELDAVFASKLAGTLHLDELTQDRSLDFFVCFSSISAELGNVGQSAYAFANSFLDHFAAWRNEQTETGKRFGHTISINWPLWAEGGMQIAPTEQQRIYQLSGMAPLPSVLGLQAFYALLNIRHSQAAVIYGDEARLAKLLALKTIHAVDNISQVSPLKQLALSITQQQLYAVYLLDKLSPAYNIGIALEFNGQLETHLLTQALKIMISQHAALRTAISNLADKPSAAVYPAIEFELPVVSLATVTNQPAALQVMLTELRDQPFELNEPPLWRMRLIKLNSTKSVLVAIFHHIIMDGWSLSLFIKALLDGYQQLAQGQSARLKPVAYDYADYLAFQQQQLTEAKLAETLKHWRGQFTNIPEPLALPFTKPRTASPADIQQVVIHLPDALTTQLKSAAQQHGVTLFAYFLSAYQVFLARYTNQQDIVVGVPFLGRDSHQMQETLGLFINTLPLASRLADDLLFDELLQRNQQQIELARQYQTLPLNLLLNELQVERSLEAQPLFQVLFNLISVAQPQPTLSNLQASIIWEETGRPAYDLNCEIQTNANGVKVCLKYNANLFDQAIIAQMAQHFNQLLAHTAAVPTQALAGYSILNQAEREQLLLVWNQTQATFPTDKTIHQLLEAQAKLTPDKPALIFNGQQLSYRELNTKANQLAYYLRQQGVSAETIVAVSLERSSDLIIALFAILKAGGAYLPLDHANPQDRLEFMLQDSQAAFLITQTLFEAKFPAYQGKVIWFDQLQALFATDSNQTDVKLSAQPTQLAYIIYTSGSTGQPKGVMVEHHSVVNCLYAIRELADISADSIFLAVTSLSFDVAALDYFLPLAIGASTVIASQPSIKDPKQLLELFAHYKPTAMQATPALWRMLVNSGWHASAGFKVLTAGEALAKDLAAALLAHCQVYNIYGPTEASIYATFAHIKAAQPITIGKPIANLQAYILDNNLQPVPIGVAGELFIGGAGIARGYLHRPELTRERFVPNPFATDKTQQRLYRTGDLARYLPDGNIDYLGRIDNQVKLRGYRIELGEIEHKLGELSGVKQAVVILHEDDAKFKQLLAFIVPQANPSSLTEAEILAKAARWLPDYMLPNRFILLESLPLSPNGKIDKKALLLLVQQSQTNLARLEPTADNQPALLQQVLTDLTQLVSEVVQLAPAAIPLQQAFGTYGFDSLRFGELSIKVARKYAIDISPALFYRYTHLTALAKHLLQTYPQQLQQVYAQHSLAVALQQPGKTPLENAANAVEALKLKPSNRQDIAVIGIASRLPQAPTKEQFWQNLAAGKDAITEIPEQRWDWRHYVDLPGAKWGGFIDDVDKFDAAFFSISPVEAQFMDPQQRLLLESAWAAIEDAGLKPSELIGTNTGVYVGSTGTEYVFMQQAAGIGMDTHSISGGAQSIAANRISYWFNLTGPSAPIDTACSSSLVAVHRAMMALQAGECNMALVAGVNLLLSPDIAYQGLSKMGMLSEDGRCKAFAEAANGYVRGEGIVTLLLKPLAQAEADQDPVYAVLKGSAENHGGKTHGLTIPNPEAQSKLIINAYTKANIDPATIAYIEAHGTGTRLGDPIEIDGLKQAFATLYQQRQGSTFEQAHCGIGSAKSNVGHLEGAAGITGLLKVILATQHKTLPASLHIKQTNPEIKLAGSPFYLTTETRAWDALLDEQGKTIPRRAGVSSFGFGGSNVHVVVEEAPARQQKQEAVKPYYLITLSAKQPVSLQQKMAELATWLQHNANAALSAVAYTLNAKREHFDHRCALVVNSTSDLQASLQQASAGKSALHCLFSEVAKPRKHEPVFAEILLKLLDDISDYQTLAATSYQQKLLALADLYCKGYELDWELLHQAEIKQRISLPTYPFQRKRFWFEHKPAAKPMQQPSPLSQASLGYYAPSWRASPLAESSRELSINRLYVFSDDEKLIQAIRQNLPHSQVIQVRAGNDYQCIDMQTYQLQLGVEADYERLLQETGIGLSHVLMARHFSLNDLEHDLEASLQEHYNFFRALGRQAVKQSCYCLSIYLAEPQRLAYEYMLVGFAKSMRQEHAQFTMRVLGIEAKIDLATLSYQLCAELSLCNQQAVHSRYQQQIRQLEHYQALPSAVAKSNGLRKQGVYLITGGLGGLGFLLAQYLAKTYQAKLVLTGRTELNETKQAQLQQLQDLGALVIYLSGDVADEATVQAWLSTTKQQFGELHGIIHCAGCIDDTLLQNKTWKSFKAVLAAKVWGSLHLDKASQTVPLDCFVLFSSLSAVLGNRAQTDYASANAFLDEFARWRSVQAQRQGKTLAINWPYWAEGGMRLAAFLVEQQLAVGLHPLCAEDGWQAFEYALQQQAPVLTVVYGEQQKISKLLTQAPVTIPTPVAKPSESSSPAILQQELIQLMADILKAPVAEIKPAGLLSDYGVDSILLTSLAQQISQRYQINLSPAQFYTFTTLAELTDVLLQSYASELAAYWQAGLSSSTMLTKPVLSKPEVSHKPLAGESFKLEEIAIVGMSCLLPEAESLADFWRNLMANKISTTPLPASRTADWLSLAEQLNFNLTDIKGAFIDDVASFDAKFFKMVPREAQLLDPQQRLLLQEAWHCIEHAGYDPAELRGNHIGVYVGAQATDYADLMQHIIDPKVVTGTLRNMLANRISYQFGFTGPSETVDASCISSLVALQHAVRAIQTGDCKTALVAGVSLLLSPRSFIGAHQLGLLAKDGRCHSFGAGGTGFAKGEGLGVLMLKTRKQAEADGDTIYGLIKGIAVNHNGYSHTITSPNGRRQADVILAACQQAQLDPATIGYIEAQATGAETTDAVEFAAYKQAWQHSPQADCYIGSVKPNIGHLEPASGIIGMIKVLLAMRHKTIPGLYPFAQLNPQIQLAKTPFKFTHEAINWPSFVNEQGETLPRRAAIHNIAAGGLNAHVIVEEYTGTLAMQRQPLPAYAFAKTRYWYTDLLKDSRQSNQQAASVSLQQEQQVAGLVAALVGLPVEQLEPGLSLFEQGIDSILLAQIIAKVEQDFSCDISAYVPALLENPSIGNIAKYASKAEVTPLIDAMSLEEERVVAL